MKIANEQSPEVKRLIFLSFKSDERELAEQLKAALHAEGFDVWWQEEIQCGHEWHGEIDKAVANAGCLIVLWTKASLQSPWVMHEASMAMALGTYAPVRMELVEIQSPFNRIQATDLIDWDGQKNHPGFENLLSRARELLPVPLTSGQRLTRWLQTNTRFLVASLVAVSALALLLRLAALTEGQVLQQEEIAHDIVAQVQQQQAIAENVEHVLNPIENFRATFSLRLPMSVLEPDLVQALEELVVRVGDVCQFVDPLPAGVSPHHYRPNGTVDSVSYNDLAASWPNVIRDIGFTLDFGLDPASPGDLLVPLLAGTRGIEILRSHLRWGLGQHGQACGDDHVTFTVTLRSPPEVWRASGAIRSTIHLEQSVVDIDVALPKGWHESPAADAIVLRSLLLQYSGGQKMLRGAMLQKMPCSGLCYRASLSKSGGGSHGP